MSVSSSQIKTIATAAAEVADEVSWKEWLRETWSNTWELLSGPLRREMWLMLFINFAIQFG